MIAMPPRPRFYALIWAQAVGFAMIISGMLPYWLNIGGAHVPRTISWRVGVLSFTVLLMFFAPLIKNTSSMITRGLGEGEITTEEPLADDARMVRRLIWAYFYVDLAFLTYLVHITGGITGSMYAGLYLLIPPLSLLLILDSADLTKAVWLTAFSAIGIFAGFLMSQYNWIEFDAAQHKHAFAISLALVTVEGISIPLLQTVILKYQLKKEAPEPRQSSLSAPTQT